MTAKCHQCTACTHTHTHTHTYIYIYIYIYGDCFVSVFPSLSASFSTVWRVNTCLESTVARAWRMLKMSSYPQNMDYHYQNKTVSLQSHLHVRESLYLARRSSYWNGAHLAVRLKSIGRRADESQWCWQCNFELIWHIHMYISKIYWDLSKLVYISRWQFQMHFSKQQAWYYESNCNAVWP